MFDPLFILCKNEQWAFLLKIAVFCGENLEERRGVVLDQFLKKKMP